MTPAELAGLDREAFLAAFGDVFEHSPWVAEGAWKRAPFRSLDPLHAAMVQVLREAAEERQLALIRAHPDLAGKAAIQGELTSASTEEQARSGLSSLTPQEFARFQELNDAYKARFGFPLIIAVKGLGKDEILAAFERRLGNDPETERRTALEQIERIALLRLRDLVR
jgi:2-oxo-4-hydroxy-4-carboxy-5-ureidoimidazoline decarboxylase